MLYQTKGLSKGMLMWESAILASQRACMRTGRGFNFPATEATNKNDTARVSDVGIGLAGRTFACMRMPFRATNSTQVLFV